MKSLDVAKQFNFKVAISDNVSKIYFSDDYCVIERVDMPIMLKSPWYKRILGKKYQYTDLIIKRLITEQSAFIHRTLSLMRNFTVEIQYTMNNVVHKVLYIRCTLKEAVSTNLDRTLSGNVYEVLGIKVGDIIQPEFVF